MIERPVSVVCEIVLILSCLFSIRHVYHHTYRSGSPLFQFPALGWLFGFCLIGLGALLGALCYSNMFQLVILDRDLHFYHRMISRFAGYFGAMNIALASFLSIAAPLHFVTSSGKVNSLLQRFVPVGLCLLFAIVQYLDWYGMGAVALIDVRLLDMMHCRVMVGDFVRFGPAIAMVFLLVWSCYNLLSGSVSGIRKSKSQYLVAAILLFAISDHIAHSTFQLSMNGLKFHSSGCVGCRSLVLEPVDMFHLGVAAAVYCFANVAWPM